MDEITHYELCKKTAYRFFNKSDIVLYEYQSFATGEFPDVLCFSGCYTTLFEIKITHQDFKKDCIKDCRTEYKVKYILNIQKRNEELKKIVFGDPRMQEFIKEAPHIGRVRYYVCPSMLIQPNEIQNGWGLYWFKNDRFYKKKESKHFKNNLYDEFRLITHAFRKHANGTQDNILIKKYSSPSI